jgi:hypothetical protein
MNTNRFLVGILVAFTIITLLFITCSVTAQERVEVLSDFESWTERSIKESALIGGKTKTLYKLGGTWDCSNAHAKAFGIDKVSVSVTPEKRGEGTCCRMESTLETVSAIGIDFKALATGSIFTGKMIDVVGMKKSNDPNSAIDMGVPFTKRPTALVLDYKAKINPNGQIVYANAGTRVKNVAGRDKGQIVLVLQHRWEENGHVYAYRVGTATEYIEQSTSGWVDGHRVEVCYGEPKSDCKQPWHELTDSRFKTRNSQGKMVNIEEVGFRGEMQPTHMIIQISSGSMPPFTGCPGNIVWCDNIRLAYDHSSDTSAGLRASR